MGDAKRYQQSRRQLSHKVIQSLGKTPLEVSSSRCCWTIWLERNNRIFQNYYELAYRVIRRVVIFFIRIKILLIAGKKPPKKKEQKIK